MLTISRLVAAAICIVMAFLNPANAGMIVVPTFGFATVSDLTQNVTRSDDKNNLNVPLEVHCLATALFHEARGEVAIGQLAVGKTILNRVRSSAYPDSICSVVYQNSHRFNKCQFSFACDAMSDIPNKNRVFADLLALSNLLVSGQGLGVVDQASPLLEKQEFFTHYHRHDVNPAWSDRIKKMAQIGQHIFLSSERVVKRYQKNVVAVGHRVQLPAINASNTIGL